MKRDAIVVFAKEAIPGRVKTRLTPELSDEEAATLYRAFAGDILEMVAGFGQASAHREPYLAWSGSREGRIARQGEGLGFSFIDQGEGDLGDRLKKVFEELRHSNVDRVVVIGTDSPSLSKEHLETAFLELRFQEVVLGPSFDGGYYLVGADFNKTRKGELERALFEEISWSTGEVLVQTWERLKRAGVLCELLGFWYDVDTVEDLERLRFHLKYLASREEKIGTRTREALHQLKYWH